MNLKTMLMLILIFYVLQINTNASEKNENLPGNDKLGFNDLIGNWDCKAISRNKDGTWKTDTTKATWVFFELFGGEAVQDIFYGGVSYEQIDTASRGGTNIRIFNKDDNKWHMAWFDTNNRRIAVFTAVGEKDKIIMEGINAKGRQIKNIFSEISDEHFTWVQYWTFDKGKTWIDVSKIFCKKILK